MDTICLDRSKQNEFDKKVKNIKKRVKSREITIDENSKRRKFNQRRIRKKNPCIYLGSIPHGFYENEMKSYFSQFGRVLRVNLARSAKTGRSKGYAFIEFKDEEVARIAAESMNNYLMFNRVMKCKYIPPEERKGKMLKKIDPDRYPKKINRINDFKNKNRAASNLTESVYQEKAIKKLNELRKFFERKGFEFYMNMDVSSKEPCENSMNPDSSSTTLTTQADNDLGILEIDESDTDIQFKTPPHVKKIIKRSISSKSQEGNSKSKTSKETCQNKLLRVSTKKSSITDKKIQAKSKITSVKKKKLNKGKIK